MVKYLIFTITKASVNIFAEFLHDGIAAIDMKNIKRDLSLKAWKLAPGVDLGGGPRPKLNFFSEYGHAAYQIKADDVCSNMVANILPLDTHSTQGWGQNVKSNIFVKVVMLHIKLKEIEQRAP